MRNISLILIVLISFSSCKSSKTYNTSVSKSKKTRTKPSKKRHPKTDNIVDYAKQFEGVRYKYGGNSKKGMDCSGLVATAFKSEDISLPRTTGDLAVTGDWIDLKEVQKGDLVFFATKKNSRKVNHVGIVTAVRPGFVEFIHASTSKGVMISNLTQRYWYYAYVQARRVLKS